MRFGRSCRGVRSGAFTLIEVMLAVAIFSGAIVAVLGLLGPSLRVTREVLDTSVAARLAEGIDSELERVGFAFVSGQTVAGGEMEIVATADGSSLVVANQANNDPITGTPPGIATEDRYFRIVVRRLDAPAAPADGSFLALAIRAEWPFSGPAGATEVTERKWFTFNTAMRP